MNAIAGTSQYPTSADPSGADAPSAAAAAAAPAANSASANALPRSIPEYLQRLREALQGADPALIQDALYDAEEYLRSEMADNPGQSEAQIIAAVAGSYGAPDEVADIYRDTEVKVQTALRAPRPAPRKSVIGRFFAVALEPRTYGSLFYMLFSLVTGIFYFTWVSAGVSLSLSLLILIIGVPLLILFLGSVRALSLVEGRLVEVMLGERMPRRPLYTQRGRPVMERIKVMFTDPRTWGTLLYMMLMLPLGIIYFTVAVTGLATSLAFMLAPFAVLSGLTDGVIMINNVSLFGAWEPWVMPVFVLIGVLLFFVTLHIARWTGYVHAQVAKHLLVEWAQRD